MAGFQIAAGGARRHPRVARHTQPNPGRPSERNGFLASDPDGTVAHWYQDHLPRLQRIAVRMLGDEAAAADVAQETLVRAWQHSEELTDRDDVGAWLTRVAHNLCIDALRSRRRLVPLTDLDVPIDRDERATEIEAADERMTLRRALAGISPRHRRALYLREIEGVPYPELASVLGIDEVATRMVVSRARGALRRQLRTAASGVSGAVVAIRIRFGRLGRAVTDPGWYPLSPAILQAAATAMVVASIAVAAAWTPAPGPSSEHVAATHVVAEHAPFAPAGQTMSTSTTRAQNTARGVNVSADDNSMRMDAGVENPMTGRTENAWVHFWRDPSGGRSALLETSEQTIESGCRETTTCGTARTLADSGHEGPTR